MMDANGKRELISALADGELQREAFGQVVELAAVDEHACEAWRMYHLIGDVMRSSDLAQTTAPDLFLARLRAQLENEAPVRAAVTEREHERVSMQAPAANDPSFRWKLVAGVASVAAVAAIGWSVIGAGSAGTPQPAQLAVATPPAGTVLANSDRGPIIRDPRLDELLAAHRQLGSAPGLQSAGFLRNATFDAPAQNR